LIWPRNRTKLKRGSKEEIPVARIRDLAVWQAMLALALACGCENNGAGAGGSGGAGAADGGGGAATEQTGFADCDALLDYARSHTQELIDASPIGAPFPEPSPCASNPACDALFSPDSEFYLPLPAWKAMDESVNDHGGHLRVSDGVVYFVQSQRLFSWPLDGGPADLSVLPNLGGSLFVTGERALLVNPGSSTTTLVEVDISNRSAMKIVRTREIVGRGVGVARVGQTVRVAVQSRPRLDWEIAGTGGGLGSVPSNDPAAVAAAREHNGALVLGSEAADWLATYDEIDPSGARQTLPLLGCDAVHAPEERGGMSLLTIIDIDLGQGLASWRAVGLFAEGATLFGNRERSWIATAPWQKLSDKWLLPAPGAGQDLVSSLHAFASPADGFRPLGVATLPGLAIDLTESPAAGGAYVLARKGAIGLRGSTEFEATVSYVEQPDDSLRLVATTAPFTLAGPTGMALSADVLLIPSFVNEVPTRRVDVRVPNAPVAGETMDLYGPWIKLFPLPDGRLAALGRAVDKNWNYDAAQSFLRLLQSDSEIQSFDLGDFEPDCNDPDGFQFDAETQTLVTCGLTFAGSLVDGIDCQVFDVGVGSARQLGTVVHPDPPLPNYGYRDISTLGIANGQLITVSQTELRTTDLPSMTLRASVELPFPPTP
jgi:hypothetical protein